MIFLLRDAGDGKIVMSSETGTVYSKSAMQSLCSYHFTEAQDRSSLH